MTTAAVITAAKACRLRELRLSELHATASSAADGDVLAHARRAFKLCAHWSSHRGYRHGDEQAGRNPLARDSPWEPW